MAKRSEACAGVDVGGTFTDVVVHAGGHSPRAVKVPTTPGDQAEGVAHGVHEGWPGGPPRLLPHGTTTTTNAVLERKIARTVLVTTEGFADVLQIARTGRRCTTCPWPARSRWCRTTRSLRLPSEPALTGARWSSSPTRRSGAWSARSSEPIPNPSRSACCSPTPARSTSGGSPPRWSGWACRSAGPVPCFRGSASSSGRPPACSNAAMEPVMRRYLSNLSSRLPEPKITVMTSSGGTAGAAGAYPNRYLVKQRCRVKDAPVERRRWSRESSESDDARLMAITLTELSVSGRARPPSEGGVAQAALSA